jgi:hypothetical protein
LLAGDAVDHQRRNAGAGLVDRVANGFRGGAVGDRDVGRLAGRAEPACVSSRMVSVPPVGSVPPVPEKGVAAVELARPCCLANCVTSRL